jgi:hypothetical protein
MKETQELLQKKTAELIELQTEIYNLRRKLRDNCDHSETQSYVWEHDNGYGKQTNITGKRCVFCWFVDLWNRGNFIDPSSIDSEY